MSTVIDVQTFILTLRDGAIIQSHKTSLNWHIDVPKRRVVPDGGMEPDWHFDVPPGIARTTLVSEFWSALRFASSLDANFRGNLAWHSDCERQRSLDGSISAAANHQPEQVDG
jgi:hypothetical protein